MSRAAKKAKTSEAWPTIGGVPTMEGLDKPLVQTLATVVSKLYDEALYAAWKPEGDIAPDKFLAQPYELSKEGGQYKEGGEYTVDGYTGGKGALVSGYDVFNHLTKAGEYESLAQYGTVIDGITDFHGESQAFFPPFAALIVQPKDKKEAPILILAWRGSTTLMDWVNDMACAPSLSSRWSGETKDIRAHGMILNLVENTFSLHEDEIVALALKHKVEHAFFTGHSLGGGIANVAHLVVRAQLKKAGSPWHKLADKVTWLACTFASLQTIVRKYDVNKKPPLMAELDDSSYNVVYGCDAVPRAPGMLNFLGDCVEVVAPKILEEIVDKKAGLFASTAWFTLQHLIKHFVTGGIDGATVDVVKSFKNNGLAEVMRQFTHVGTVVYLAAEGLNPPKQPVEYVHLNFEAAEKKLNVEGNDFLTLWGDENTYMESAQKAHNESYHRLIFKSG